MIRQDNKTGNILDNDPLVECRLMVINGQYLMFDTGVINIGEFSPYEVSVSY